MSCLITATWISLLKWCTNLFTISGTDISGSRCFTFATSWIRYFSLTSYIDEYSPNSRRCIFVDRAEIVCCLWFPYFAHIVWENVWGYQFSFRKILFVCSSRPQLYTQMLFVSKFFKNVCRNRFNCCFWLFINLLLCNYVIVPVLLPIVL